jgi:hypothetical protein
MSLWGSCELDVAATRHRPQMSGTVSAVLAQRALL